MMDLHPPPAFGLDLGATFWRSVLLFIVAAVPTSAPAISELHRHPLLPADGASLVLVGYEEGLHTADGCSDYPTAEVLRNRFYLVLQTPLDCEFLGSGHRLSPALIDNNLLLPNSI